MEAAALIREARTRAGLSLRDLAVRAATSHSTLAAYEAGRVDPQVHTLERIVAAAGFQVDTQLVRHHDERARGRELEEALRLAAQFPTRHTPTLEAPIFGARAGTERAEVSDGGEARQSNFKAE